MKKACSVPDCERALIARGLCKLHYERKARHGSPDFVKFQMSPRGAPRAWIEAHVRYDGTDCLIWPFSRHPDGRANGSPRPTRLMCELAHGPAPSAKHEAAHSCGRGHDACVHPAHLRWATPVENAADKELHGTVSRGERHYAAKLTDAQVVAIRSLDGTMLRKEIAAQFGVYPSAISKILKGQRRREA